MRIYRSIEELHRQFVLPVATLGNFDGVHLGHREIFRKVKRKARALGGESMVVTFIPHPLKVLAPQRSPLLINTYEEKEILIEASGVDHLVTIPFTREFAAISAEEFIRGTLVGRIGVRGIVVGEDYAFGRGREGSVDLLRRLGEELGFEVDVLEPIGNGDAPYSSSRVRKMVTSGEVAEVVALLGRHFSVAGEVVHGQNRGAGLGFPTANLRTPKELLPGDGVYAVKAKVGDGEILDGACNIGTNPTFGDAARSVEVFLFDFRGDLYGRDIRIYFIERIRDERTFGSVDELRAAIAADVARCRELLAGRQIMEFRDYLEEV